MFGSYPQQPVRHLAFLKGSQAKKQEGFWWHSKQCTQSYNAFRVTDLTVTVNNSQVDYIFASWRKQMVITGFLLGAFCSHHAKLFFKSWCLQQAILQHMSVFTHTHTHTHSLTLKQFFFLKSCWCALLHRSQFYVLPCWKAWEISLFLLPLSLRSSSSDDKAGMIEQRILDSNPILEAFGKKTTTSGSILGTTA